MQTCAGFDFYRRPDLGGIEVPLFLSGPSMNQRLHVIEETIEPAECLLSRANTSVLFFRWDLKTTLLFDIIYSGLLQVLESFFPDFQGLESP